MSYKKKLIEVALPLAEINEACVDDKDRKTGHIRGLHKWFAPMPLPAWRALLFASIVDDPGNTLTPAKAQKERAKLFKIIERLVQFDAVNDPRFLEEVKSILDQYKPEGAVIVDPFCGGGSTALEAQRLGFDTLATDLNPVPVLITTLLTNAIPMATELAPISPKNPTLPGMKKNSSLDNVKKDFVFYAEKVSVKAKKKLEKLFPKHSSGEDIFAWRWAWAVKSPHPSARGGYTPLVTDWELWRAKGKSTWIVPEVNQKKNEITFSIREGGKEVSPTVANRSATCLYTGRPISLEYIREEGKHGRLKPMLLAGVASAGSGQRYFIAPTEKFLEAANVDYPTDAPSLEMPAKALGFRVQEYGISDFKDLFLPRQSRVLCAFADSISELREEIISDAVAAGIKKSSKGLFDEGSGAEAYADTVMLFLSLCLGKMAQANNILTRWVIDPRNGSAKAVQSFDRHAVPMVWDFVETNPFGGSVGDWLGPVVKTALLALNLTTGEGVRGKTGQLDARNLPDKLSGKCLIATDPPYYANIGYADLSDFFYIWHRKALRKTFPNLFQTIGTPKANELIASPFRHEGRGAADEYFRNGFIEVFSKANKLQHPDLPMVIVYAYKQKDSDDPGIVGTGWEAMLEAIIKSGLSVVGTLPIRAVRKARMVNIGTNSLASAVAIICRRPPSTRKTATKREFLNHLKKDLPAAISALTQSGIAPVDLAQALIGPGMAVYCSYEKVLESNDDEMTVRGALESINHVVTETITKQDGSFDAETRWCLTWFEQSGFEKAEYGDANLLAQAKNITVERLSSSGVVESKSGNVRLLKRSELKDDWEPSKKTSVWLATQYLIKYLQEDGEAQAGLLLRELGNLAADCKDIAYRCFTICESKGWSSEAVALNSLILSWGEIAKIAVSEGTIGIQEKFDV